MSKGTSTLHIVSTDHDLSTAELKLKMAKFHDNFFDDVARLVDYVGVEKEDEPICCIVSAVPTFAIMKHVVMGNTDDEPVKHASQIQGFKEAAFPFLHQHDPRLFCVSCFDEPTFAVVLRRDTTELEKAFKTIPISKLMGVFHWVRRYTRFCKVTDQESNRKCDSCDRGDVALRKCSRCLSAYYCSRACQRNKWPEHKLICKGFTPSTKAMFPKEPTWFLL